MGQPLTKRFGLDGGTDSRFTERCRGARACDRRLCAVGGVQAEPRLSREGRMQLRRVTDWLQGWSGVLRLVLRTTLAGLITCTLAHLLELPQAIWAVLTSVLIMQASVGASLQASLDRMLGTVAGAIWGVSVTLAIPHREA